MISSAEGPEVLTYSDIKALIFSSIYQPQLSFKMLGYLLPELEAASGDLIDEFSVPFRLAHTLSCGLNGTVSPTISYTADVPTFAILCGDGLDQQNITIDEFVEYWDLLKSMSSAGGDIWAMLRMKCAAWNIRASYKYEGEFGGNTSHPILFVSNTADPVTPLRSGRIMHSKFPNSGLLVNDQAGHCSFSGTNLCAYEKIKEYFQTGALPAKNTLCAPPPSAFSLNSTDPKSPFYDPSLEVGAQIATDSKLNVQQQKMHSAAKHFERVMAEIEVFGFNGLVGGPKAVHLRKVAMAKYLD
jgi:hypothetical protein